MTDFVIGGVPAVVGRVVAIPAIDHIGSGVADKMVVTSTAKESVGSRSAIEEVIAVSAKERVCAMLAENPVVAFFAKDAICTGPTEDGVFPCRSDQFVVFASTLDFSHHSVPSMRLRTARSEGNDRGKATLSNRSDALRFGQGQPTRCPK